ncbi:nuclear transport factor 2 family protein [Streptomyces hiroshimensis]|uniref:Ketosteroid isomerase n=1 Tax=Streptomyces hiroshimensis TaxID=66424 RepID=A0ABQ2YCN7_9ACTN|nr:nuclear transport factor 2 family protein [Streptomyces hiroshimensis]GGX77534.1 ketosteroid isomerase [Streptomyces hiroshimensis]
MDHDRSDATRSAVQAFLTRFGEGDPERTAALFAGTVDWMIVGDPAVVPWVRARSTRADVAAHFRELGENVTQAEGSPVVDALLADGRDAVVTGVIIATIRGTGKDFRTPFALRLSVEDGLLTRFHLYEDSLAVARAAGL